MTIEEKSKKILDYCRGRHCSNCVIHHDPLHVCGECAHSRDDEVIERNYQLIYGGEKSNKIKKKMKLPKKKQYEELANDAMVFYQSFIEVGFSEKQAWEILKISINKGK